MKCYHVLECSNLVSIQQETLLWLDQHQDLFESKEYWNKIDYIDFIRNSPSLMQYINGLGLKLRECAILIGYEDGLGRHTDEGPIIAKINIPILNTQDTYTEWYDGDKQIARIEINQPVVFNSSIPHQVVMGEQARTPRIMLACMFYQDPTDYLNDQ
jgi:hypothetical protein